MTNDRGPSPLGPDSPYSDASIYVYAEAAPRVVGRLRDALGLVEDDGAELTGGPVRVESEPNDYATDRHAHPFDVLQWPTVLVCEARAGTPDEVVQADASVLEALWHGDFRAVATFVSARARGPGHAGVRHRVGQTALRPGAPRPGYAGCVPGPCGGAGSLERAGAGVRR